MGRVELFEFATQLVDADPDGRIRGHVEIGAPAEDLHSDHRLLRHPATAGALDKVVEQLLQLVGTTKKIARADAFRMQVERVRFGHGAVSQTLFRQALGDVNTHD
jgi:hypothetical protein